MDSAITVVEAAIVSEARGRLALTRNNSEAHRRLRSVTEPSAFPFVTAARFLWHKAADRKHENFSDPFSSRELARHISRLVQEGLDSPPTAA